MATRRVAIGSMGGTIAMTRRCGGLLPTLDVDQLLASVPDLGVIASVQAETLTTVPGASLGFVDLLAAVDWARDVVNQGAVGVVLVQGTDTLEESAYLLDLLWDRPEPLVVTGAMRSAQDPGPDGPANLWASVVVAAHAGSRDLGVLVTMNDQVHAASRVTKGDSMAVDAFRSPVFGPLGRIVESRPIYGNRSIRHAPLPSMSSDETYEPRVALLTTHLGDSGDLIRLAADAGYNGVVLAALGVGHVSAAVAAAVGQTAHKMSIVFASVSGAGPTAEQTYAFAGSETDLISRGATPAGWLAPVKARLLLWALLRLRYSPQEVQVEFARRARVGPDASYGDLRSTSWPQAQHREESCR